VIDTPVSITQGCELADGTLKSRLSLSTWATSHAALRFLTSSQASEVLSIHRHDRASRWGRALDAVPAPGAELDNAGVEPAGSSATMLTGGYVQAVFDGDACVVHGLPSWSFAPSNGGSGRLA
jgi:hypothetical protein